jgi:hypothetical protein
LCHLGKLAPLSFTISRKGLYMTKMLLKATTPQRRVQIDFNESEVEEIEGLLKICGLATKKDLFNNALTVLRWCIREVESGHEIASIDRENERYYTLAMTILDAARRHSASAKASVRDSLSTTSESVVKKGLRKGVGGSKAALSGT